MGNCPSIRRALAVWYATSFPAYLATRYNARPPPALAPPEQKRSVSSVISFSGFRITSGYRLIESLTKPMSCSRFVV
ncbi:MAG: hypothetical protein GY714_06185 [Desulfobacterales bacterium]|nr:hypothetical protein [Desulfobacterales bacterium]MCP4162482.1 hypothetical protein [Deltaproteobacteria bacterium]